MQIFTLLLIRIRVIKAVCQVTWGDSSTFLWQKCFDAWQEWDGTLKKKKFEQLCQVSTLKCENLTFMTSGPQFLFNLFKLHNFFTFYTFLLFLHHKLAHLCCLSLYRPRLLYYFIVIVSSHFILKTMKICLMRIR